MRKINEHWINLDCFFILFLEIIDDILKKNTKEQINMKRFVDQTSHEINDKDDSDFLFFYLDDG